MSAASKGKRIISIPRAEKERIEGKINELAKLANTAFKKLVARERKNIR